MESRAAYRIRTMHKSNDVYGLERLLECLARNVHDATGVAGKRQAVTELRQMSKEQRHSCCFM